MLAVPITAVPLPMPTRSKLDPEQVAYTSQEQRQAIAGLIDELSLTPATLKKIKDHFILELNKGLARDGETVAMVPVHVAGRLNGSETGSYLTLDIGGTNLRVVSVVLGQGLVTTQQKQYKIEEELKVGDAKFLFVEEHRITVPAGTEIEFGFTFSFPVLQTAINSGTLITWTKGFNCPGAVGADPAALLQDAFRRRKMPVRVAALLNDTVGTLLTHAYDHQYTVIGLGLGTGCNGAYIERLDRITKWNPDTVGASTGFKEMVVNMEFGAFDSERRVLPVTMFDNKLDRKSLNPGKQIFEKMVAGMYLGEITRNILVHLIDRQMLLKGQSSLEMNRVWAFDTTYMSTIEADGTADLEDTRLVLENYMGYATSGPMTSIVDRQIVKVVVGLVGQRAARLSAAALAGILEHTRDITWSEEAGGADIGVDGSLFRYYPNFESDIKDGLADISDFERESANKGKAKSTAGVDMNTVRMGLSTDGSGVGAALCALLAATSQTANKY